LAALRQIDLKKLLAYTSVAHMNLLALGLISSNGLGILGGSLFQISHGFVAAGLFILIGQLYARCWTRNLKYLRGLSEAMPIFASCFLLLNSANISVPGFMPFVSELLILLGLVHNPVILGGAISSVVLSSAYSF
jgi:NADH:ubiquinone oxidoreductase subunit 4 (subunit M)